MNHLDTDYTFNFHPEVLPDTVQTFSVEGATYQRAKKMVNGGKG